MTNWMPTENALPEKNRAIWWISPGGEQVLGKFLGGTVWMPENSSCYVYYRPTYWKYSE